jgi:hypothetical protein
MMKAIHGYFRGTGGKELRLTLYSWIINALAGTAILWGFHEFFRAASGNPLSDKGVYYFWLPTFLNDLSHNYPGSMAALAISAAAILIAAWLLSVFLSGGVYAAILDDGRVSARRFLALSARHFARMVRVFFANIPNFLLAAVVPGILFYIHYKKQSAELDESLLVFFIYGWCALLVFFLIYSLAVYDLSRLHSLKEDQKAFRALRRGFAAVFSRKAKVFAIFFIYIAVVAALLLAYAGITRLTGEGVPAALIIAVQQLFLFLRLFSKVLLMRAEAALLEEV